MTALTSKVALSVPPEMMTALALGMEDGAIIAQRYGYSGADFATLVTQPWFTKALQTKRDNLEDEGWTFKAKMAMLAEDLLLDVWAVAKESESGALKLDVAKYFTKIAELEPKPNAAQLAPGSGFSITISLPSAPVADQRTHPSDAASQAIDITPPQIDIKLPETDALAGPQPFIVPDFDLSGNDDLAALPAEYATLP